MLIEFIPLSDLLHNQLKNTSFDHITISKMGEKKGKST